MAELAVALAGFGSLAALIGRRRGAEPAEVDAARLRAMLERSLVTMIFAVLPVSLARFGFAPHIAWVSSGSLLAIVVPLEYWTQVRRARKIPEYQQGTAYRMVGQLALLSTVGLLLAGLLGLIPLDPAYGLALVVELSVAAGMFLRVASSLMANPGSPAV